ncbi:hypothetical protein TI03_02285 [Achromatium sp. WMS1]|nr:hypothetical protein TI03_02285 [Achromatium sp. WMS1]
MKKLVPFLAVLGCLVWTTQANAIGGAFYRIGRNSSSSVAMSAWRNLGRDCTKADRLLQILGDSVDRTARTLRSGRYSGRSAQDFGAGYIDGLVNVLDGVIDKCTGECTNIGNFAGQAAAEIFCAVGDAIGGTPSFSGLQDRPNIVCGEAYRMGCESNFVNEATGMCPMWAQGPNYDDYYPSSRNGCCAFDDSP